MASNESDSEELDDWDDDPFVGWWVGEDDNWYPPDEPFGSRQAARSLRVRRVVMVVVAVAVVAATSVSVWGGALTSPSSDGPTPSVLAAQVRRVITGGSNGESPVGAVTTVTCHPPPSWTSGARFTCEVLGPSEELLGHYDGTVQPGPTSAGWRWVGVWKPSHQGSVQ